MHVTLEEVRLLQDAEEDMLFAIKRTWSCHQVCPISSNKEEAETEAARLMAASRNMSENKARYRGETNEKYRIL